MSRVPSNLLNAHVLPSREPRTAGRFRPAFSFVELLLVIAIIGVISAIAVPRYGSARATFRSRSAASRLAADLSHAVSLAQSKSVEVAVVFSPDGSGYSTIIDPDNAATIESTVVLSDPPYFATLDTSDLAPSNTLTLDGFGRTAAQETLQVTSSQRTTSLEVSTSGRVTVLTP